MDVSGDVITGTHWGVVISNVNARISLPTILAALTVNVKLPASVNVPVSAPSELSVSPGGNVPSICSQVTGLVLDALKVKL